MANIYRTPTGYVVEDGGAHHALDGDLFGEWRPGAAVEAPTVVLAPVMPSKIVCIGLNYKDHAAEQGKPLPAEPLIFLKPSSAIVNPGEAIELPEGVGRVDYESEVAVVIGRRATRVSEAEALSYVLGLTCMNDVTARDLQKKDGRYTRAKGFDTFAPLGPCIATGLSADDLAVSGPAERRGPAAVEHPRADLSRGNIDRVHLAHHDAAARRHRVDRHARGHRPAAGRRRVRRACAGHWRPSQPGCRATLAERW